MRGFMNNKRALVGLLALALSGCPDDGSDTDAGNPPTDGGGRDGGGIDGGGIDSGPFDAGMAGPAAMRPSRGSSIAIDEAATTLAVANRATDDVTLFDLSDNSERARVAV
ncbi:MAG: hypothetical protein AB7P00_35640, partial [Sandaracinaceae bacterium]